MTPCWFVLPLFIITILFYFLHRIIKNDYVILLITFIFYIFSCFARNIPAYRYFYNGCAILGNVGTGLFIYVLGYMYGKNKNKINIYFDKYGAELFVLIICLITIITVHGHYNEIMREGIWSNAFYKGISTVISIYFVMYLSKLLERNDILITKIIEYCGQHSMMIMYFHIISFAVITKSVFLITKIKWETTWTGAIPKFGFVTRLIGILIPLLLDFCLTRSVALLKDKKIKFKVGC